MLSTVSAEEKSVGAVLREAREVRGLSLADVARITRIGERYLLALEEELFDKLPSRAYVRGFLRLYANCLSLSEKDIIALYEKTEAGTDCQTEDHSPDPDPLKRGRSNSRTGRKNWYLLAFLLFAAVSVYSIMQESPDRDIRPVVRAISLPGTTKSAAPISPSPRSALPQLNVTKQEIPESLPETKVPGKMDSGFQSQKGIVLKIRVVEDGLLDIAIDDAVTHHYELKSGDQIEWKGEKVFILDISNAAGIEVEFNGKGLKPFGTAGKAAHVVLKAEEN